MYISDMKVLVVVYSLVHYLCGNGNEVLALS
jgi:hypothetical protein